MTVFRHKCETRGCWLLRRWDSNNLGRAALAADGEWPFPRGISPSDIDGFIDCAGEILVIESKEAGAPITRGQERALEALSRKGITVLLQECTIASKDAVVRVRWCMNGNWTPWKNVDRIGRDRAVQGWFTWVEREEAA